jgi:hypothetical protein
MDRAPCFMRSSGMSRLTSVLAFVVLLASVGCQSGSAARLQLVVDNSTALMDVPLAPEPLDDDWQPTGRMWPTRSWASWSEWRRRWWTR